LEAPVAPYSARSAAVTVSSAARFLPRRVLGDQVQAREDLVVPRLDDG
jgi:hypothetical protein